MASLPVVLAEAGELANCCSPTLAEVIRQAHRVPIGSGGHRSWPIRSCAVPACPGSLSSWSKLFMTANLTSTDTIERDAIMLLLLHPRPAPRIAGRAGYWSWLGVA
jgi:hypothetical protein